MDGSVDLKAEMGPCHRNTNKYGWELRSEELKWELVTDMLINTDGNFELKNIEELKRELVTEMLINTDGNFELKS